LHYTSHTLDCGNKKLPMVKRASRSSEGHNAPLGTDRQVLWQHQVALTEEQDHAAGNVGITVGNGRSRWSRHNGNPELADEQIEKLPLVN